MNFDIKIIRSIAKKNIKSSTEICVLRLYLELCDNSIRPASDIALEANLDQSSYKYAATCLKEWFDIERSENNASDLKIEKVELPNKKRKQHKVKHNQAIFDKFYASYPKKVSVQNAIKMWNRLAEPQFGDVVKTIIDVGQGLFAYLEHIKAKGIERQYIQNPASFLNPENRNYMKSNWE